MMMAARRPPLHHHQPPPGPIRPPPPHDALCELACSRPGHIINCTFQQEDQGHLPHTIGNNNHTAQQVQMMLSIRL